MFGVKILPLGPVDGAVLEYLSFTMPGNVGGRYEIGEAAVRLDEAYDFTRQQYNSTTLLARLLSQTTGNGDKILAVTEVDLFVPIFTFVFGLAQVGGAVALISTFRLKQSFYGLPENETLYYARCEKEAAHELGHTYGLAHCRSYDCVMHFSNSIEQVDLKPSTFCPACLDLIVV